MLRNWLGNPIPLSMCSWEVVYSYLGFIQESIWTHLKAFRRSERCWKKMKKNYSDPLPTFGEYSYLAVVHLYGKCQQIRLDPWIFREISTNKLRKTFCFGSCHLKLLYPYTPKGEQFRPKLGINWDQLPRQVGDELQFSVIILIILKSWSWIKLWKLLSPGMKYSKLGEISWIKRLSNLPQSLGNFLQYAWDV